MGNVEKILVFLYNDHLIGSLYCSLQFPVESKYNLVDCFLPETKTTEKMEFVES